MNHAGGDRLIAVFAISMALFGCGGGGGGGRLCLRRRSHVARMFVRDTLKDDEHIAKRDQRVPFNAEVQEGTFDDVFPT